MNKILKLQGWPHIVSTIGAAHVRVIIIIFNMVMITIIVIVIQTPLAVGPATHHLQAGCVDLQSPHSTALQHLS